MKEKRFIIKDLYMDRFYSGQFTFEETLKLLDKERIKPKDVIKLLDLPIACGDNFADGWSVHNRWWIARAIN